MKLVLQYTSNIDKEHIREAAQIKDDDEAIAKGWLFCGSGVYKTSYKKGNIVLKLSRVSGLHMLNELNFYRNAPRKHKQYLARIFGGNEDILIQKMVYFDPCYDYSRKERDQIYKIAREVGVNDFCPGSNVVKTSHGKIVFYDFGGQMMY